MKRMIRQIVLLSGTLALGTAMAYATDMSSTPMPSGNANQAPMMHSTQGQAMHVGHQELRRFAQTVVAIQPVETALRKKIATHPAPAEKHQILTQYQHRVGQILSSHHLTPARYEALISKAQTDPKFAQRTEAEIHKHMAG